MRVKFLQNVIFDGTRYSAGDVITTSEDDARRLITAGLAMDFPDQPRHIIPDPTPEKRPKTRGRKKVVKNEQI